MGLSSRRVVRITWALVAALAVAAAVDGVWLWRAQRWNTQIDAGAPGAGPDAPAELRFDQLVIDTAGHEVRLRGTPLRLTPKEFRLLETMAREPGRAFSRLELLEQVFGFDYEGMERTVDVHVMNLRKKIEDDPAAPGYILTVYGVGYKFAEM